MYNMHEDWKVLFIVLAIVQQHFQYRYVMEPFFQKHWFMERIVFYRCHWILGSNPIHGMDISLHLSEFIVFCANKEFARE
jgi:hypothetical protein